MKLTTVAKWGNSLALRIPQAIAEQLGLKENAKVSMELDGDRLIIQRGKSLDDMLAMVTDDNQHQLIDFGSPKGNEII